MSRVELFIEIERLRVELCGLVVDRADYEKVLEISQELDELIVKYHRIAV